MKIINGHPPEPGAAKDKLEAYRTRGLPGASVTGSDSKARSAQGPSPQDRLTLSARFKEVARARERLREVEAQEEDRVKEVADAIRRGTYTVRGAQVARKLLGNLEHLDE